MSKIYHKFLLVSTDIYQNGDLFCVEVMPTTRLVEFAVGIIWLEVLIMMIIWNFFLVGRRAHLSVQLIQPLFVLYPVLKFGHCLTTAIMMGMCISYK